MAWTTPRTWVTGEIVTAAVMDTHVRDNLNVTAPAVMTTQGDIIYASGANTPARLAKDANSTRYLANTGTNNNPAWAQVSLTSGVSGVLPVANGWTNLSSYAVGDVVYASGTTALSKLNKPGSPAGEVLTFASGASAPSWVAPSAGVGIGLVIALGG